MNRALPKVSVITITYGHEKYITETLDGVLMQQYDGPVEFIIANDNSPDATDEVVKKYFLENPAPSNFEIKYTKHETNKGMMPNFIWALEQATGKYIALCEGDDYWTDPLKLQKQVDFLEENEDYILSFHQVKIKDILSEQYEEDSFTEIPEKYELPEVFAMKGNYIHTPSILFRNVTNRLNMKHNSSQIGDFFLLLHLSQFGKFGYIEQIMCVYRVGSGFFSKSSAFNKEIELLKCIISAINSLQNKKVINILIDREKLLSDYLKTNYQHRQNKAITLRIKKWIKKFLQ